MNFLETSALKDLLQKDEYAIIDIRQATAFASGFLPGSISLPYSKEADKSMLHIIKPGTAIYAVVGETEPAVAEAFLHQCGYKHIAGFISGNAADWRLAGIEPDMVITIEADELAMDLPHDDALILIDVRNGEEYENGHLAGAYHLPIYDMGDMASIAMLPEQANLYIYCSNGNRSMSAASILKRQGLHSLRVVMAGWDEISSLENMEISKDPSRLN